MKKQKIKLDEVVSLSYEMVTDGGEDSYSFLTDDRGGFIAALDGCGGSGAKTYEKAGKKTGAYIASRLCAIQLYDWFTQCLSDGSAIKKKAADEVCEILHDCLADAKKKLDVQEGRLSGSLSAKSFPTTLAAAFYENEDKGFLPVNFLWAGDSRGYILDSSGLAQVTEDDAVGGQDALHSLAADSKMTNVINADESFRINSRLVKLSQPSAVITATDGCFGYLQTPMEFEFLLLDTLLRSASAKEWGSNIKEEVLQSTGDDFTILILLFGFGSFENAKKYFYERAQALDKLYMQPLKQLRGSAEAVEKLWKDYKTTYNWWLKK